MAESQRGESEEERQKRVGGWEEEGEGQNGLLRGRDLCCWLGKEWGGVGGDSEEEEAIGCIRMYVCMYVWCRWIDV